MSYSSRGYYSRGSYGGRNYDNGESIRGTKPSEKIRYEEGAPFEEFKQITPQTIQILKERNFEKLMPVQANTFEAIYSGSNIVARDLTGSGKTLGFCLPLVEKFRESGYFESSSKVRFLRAIILAPTRELALQVSNELKKL